ncbi:AraC family transcriptional regulator [Shewanella nanhaiensis]|uniref:AraC family transcriptional regulator n=1 Tax=Shewanella nanhaiensis TaxID=2864872 RepID=A0ABS7E883_9GAMM|nr:AraC family transcriptional regulator [Shewanella nanhaiensis]MBW8185880.1 AraC family transcriptional regulator [Shewanella nanhaiensis]
MGSEHIEYWHNPALPEIELSRAKFTQFEFQKHIHLDYHIGVVSHGCQQYCHKGNTYLLTPGSISTLNPDETHNGQSNSSRGYEAHVLSIPTHYIKQISHELNQKELFFNAPLIDSPHLQSAFLQLHQMLTSAQQFSSLEIETSMMAFTTELFSKHSELQPLKEKLPTGLSHQQVNHIRALFHDDLSHAFQLETLAAQFSLSKFQFLRAFKKTVGMTPHAYLKRVRLEHAKKAIINGGSLSDIANQVGFFDQSHLNKAFKHAYLITPAHFQRRVL